MAVHFVCLAATNDKQNIEHLRALPAGRGQLSAQLIVLEDRHIALSAPLQDQPCLVVGVFKNNSAERWVGQGEESWRKRDICKYIHRSKGAFKNKSEERWVGQGEESWRKRDICKYIHRSKGAFQNNS